MTIYETKILNGSEGVYDIEKYGLKGWRLVHCSYEMDEREGVVRWFIILQRPVCKYQPPIEVGEALTQIRNAGTALRAELGITKQGSCGSALRKAIRTLESLYEE